MIGGVVVLERSEGVGGESGCDVKQCSEWLWSVRDLYHGVVEMRLIVDGILEQSS